MRVGDCGCWKTEKLDEGARPDFFWRGRGLPSLCSAEAMEPAWPLRSGVDCTRVKEERAEGEAMGESFLFRPDGRSFALAMSLGPWVI